MPPDVKQAMEIPRTRTIADYLDKPAGKVEFKLYDDVAPKV